MSETHYQELERIAIDAANLGGEILRKFFRKVDPTSIRSKLQNDWVSEADHASEDAIVSYIRKLRPNDSILTEESGSLADSPENDRFCWIIDPLDGTTNFLRGVPIWGVSIGVERRIEGEKWGEIVAAAVAAPCMSEIYSAARGDGARLNGQPITITPPQPFSAALLGTGFPFRVKHLLDANAGLFNYFFERCADIRRPGAASLDLCFVALGAYDGFWELDLSPWDIAAGSLVIEEAGGVVRNFQGGKDCLTTGDIVTAKQGIIDEMLVATRRFFPESRLVDKSPRRN
jgi:myo-inositol-1(or 4)-monophosphatase